MTLGFVKVLTMVRGVKLNIGYPPRLWRLDSIVACRVVTSEQRATWLSSGTNCVPNNDLRGGRDGDRPA